MHKSLPVKRWSSSLRRSPFRLRSVACPLPRRRNKHKPCPQSLRRTNRPRVSFPRTNVTQRRLARTPSVRGGLPEQLGPPPALRAPDRNDLDLGAGLLMDVVEVKLRRNEPEPSQLWDRWMSIVPTDV